MAWTTGERLKAIHYSVWFFGIVQLGFDVGLLMAVFAR
jgi:hypothetical protein